jgi:hypothetical protein
MNTVLMNAVAAQQPQRAAQPRRRGRGTRDGQVTAKRKVEWGLPHRGRISPEKAAWVREHLDEVQQLRSARGMPLLDPADPGPRSATACRTPPAAAAAASLGPSTGSAKRAREMASIRAEQPPGRCWAVHHRLGPPQGRHRAREAGLEVQDHHVVGMHRDATHRDVRR